MKYLTHQLVKHIFVNYENYTDFKCDICGVYLYKYNNDFFVLENNGTDINDEGKFLLTCDEVIIKI